MRAEVDTLGDPLVSTRQTHTRSGCWQNKIKRCKCFRNIMISFIGTGPGGLETPAAEKLRLDLKCLCRVGAMVRAACQGEQTQGAQVFSPQVLLLRATVLCVCVCHLREFDHFFLCRGEN